MTSTRRFLVLLLAGCLGCGEYEVALPNGYELVRLGPNEIVIVLPHIGIIISPTVREYVVLSDVVTGYAEPPPASVAGASEEAVAEGYFVIDTASGEKWVGLERAEWLERLREVGISGEPKLNEPSRFD